MVRYNADPAHRNRSLTTGPIFGVQLIDDLRLCCRTFTLNQIAHLLCSNIKYNIERHTYDAVSCYNLGKLHKMIKHDHPPRPKELVGVWKEIDAILRRLLKDTSYQYEAPLPKSA